MSAYFIWTDLETGGLAGKLDNGQLGCSYYPILEVAMIITDDQLNEIGLPLHLYIHHEEDVIKLCHEWAIETHTNTGLLDKCRAYGLDQASAEQAILDYLKSNGIEAYDRKARTGGIMAGNSIVLDRMFIAAQLPKLDAYMHYRQMDASGLALAARYWAPQVADEALANKRYTHEALADIRECIAEAKVYMQMYQLKTLPPSLS